MGWANLDADLFDLVASKLPAVEDLCRLAASCREWNQLSKDAHFNKRYHRIRLSLPKGAAVLPWLSKHYSAVHELELACSGSLCPLSAEPLVTAALLTAAGNQSVLSLQRLSIRNCCNPHLLPIICQLPSLTSLELEGVAFPGQEGGLMGLCQLTKLTHLSICSATHSSPCFSHVITEQFWDSLPQQLQQLSLVDVKFHQSQRKYAPHKLTRLTELRRLEMVDCCYMGLPDSLYQMQHLEALTLSALDKAACLGTLASLTELAIRCVPNDLGACLLRQSKLKSLAITDLGSDRASKALVKFLSTTARWLDVTHLSLAACRLTAVPPGIEQMRRLQSLDLSRNELIDFKATPHLLSLKFLNIDDNNPPESDQVSTPILWVL